MCGLLVLVCVVLFGGFCIGLMALFPLVLGWRCPFFVGSGVPWLSWLFVVIFSGSQAYRM